MLPIASRNDCENDDVATSSHRAFAQLKGDQVASAQLNDVRYRSDAMNRVARSTANSAIFGFVMLWRSGVIAPSIERLLSREGSNDHLEVGMRRAACY